MGRVGFNVVSEVLVPIIVAIISGPLLIVMNKVRKENTKQHGEAQILMRVLGRKVDRIGEKIDGHIGWHKGKDE